MTDLQVVAAVVIGVESLIIVAAMCWPRRRWSAHRDRQPAVHRRKRYRALIAGRV